MDADFRFRWLDAITRLYALFVHIVPFGWRVALVRASISRDAESILDVGGCTGTTMKIIRVCNPKYYAVNLDLSTADLKESKKRETHNEYVLGDARHLPFKKRSFDVALVSNIIEHLFKSEGELLLNNVEAIAKKRIIIAVPFNQGLYSSPDPENLHQAHISTWSTGDFLHLGYKTRRFGAPWFRGEPLACLISNKLKLTGSASSKRLFTITFVFFIDDFYDIIGGLLTYPFNKGSVLIVKKSLSSK